MRRVWWHWLVTGVVSSVVAAACTGGGETTAIPATVPTTGAPASTTAVPETTMPPATTVATSTTLPEPIGIVADPVRAAATGEVFYFVMTDRFANADRSNDFGDDPGGNAPQDVVRHGYLPTDTGYYHGGDIAGLRSKLDYLAGLGVTSIWVTPPFTNRVVQGNGTIGGSSAGYHGYWQIDYTTIDPHLGTNEEMRAFVDEAHASGMKVYFDVVVNHTGDVIIFEEGQYSYVGKTTAPYLDATGAAFDDAGVAGEDAFPDLDRETSFPYTPGFATPGDRGIKRPLWLNNPIYYHNRGNSTFSGENSLYGDFFGLDDLFTEHPVVVQGMIDIHTAMISEFDIDGFRVDTAKHVNDEFWEAWVPAVLDHAASLGKDGFFVFGEVFGESPTFRSHYTTSLPFPAVLDFGFNDAVFAYLDGVPSDVLADHFDSDDWYTDADSNASMLVKFAGNHDVGRIGRAAGNPSPGDAERLGRMSLAFGLSFLTRGVPLVYYGDEQGFIGDGGDQAARQDMFPSAVASYNDDDLIGTTATTADGNFDPDHPLYDTVAQLAALRSAHPALANGAQFTRKADGSAFSFSRIDRDERVEYVIVTNNSENGRLTAVPTVTPRATFEALLPTGESLVANEAGLLLVEIPALSFAVFRADREIPESAEAASIRISRPGEGAEINLPRFRIQADVGTDLPAEVTFAVSVDGGDFEILGTDDAPPYRVYWDTLPYPPTATVEVMATVDDLSGHRAVDTVTFTLVERG